MWRATASAWALGFEIILDLGIPGYIGYRLDRHFGTKWIIYLGLAIGVGAAIKAFLRVIREYRRAFEDTPEEKPRDDSHSGPR